MSHHTLHHNPYKMWKYALVVFLCMITSPDRVQGGRIFTRRPGDVTVLAGKTLSLRWQVPIPDAQIQYCHWQWRRSSMGAWLKFVGYANNNRERQNLAPMHEGWEFTEASEPCTGGIWRAGISEEYAGFYQFFLIDRSDKVHSDQAYVKVVQPADLKYRISISDISSTSDMSGNETYPKTIKLSHNQSIPVNVSLSWPENSISGIIITEHKQHGSCQKTNSSQPGPTNCVADVGVNSKTNSGSQLVVNMTTIVQGAESVVIHQNIDWTGTVLVITDGECASGQPTAIAFIILFVFALLGIIAMFLYWYFKIRKDRATFINEIRQLDDLSRKAICILYERLKDDAQTLQPLVNSAQEQLQREIDSFQPLRDEIIRIETELATFRDKYDTLKIDAEKLQAGRPKFENDAEKKLLEKIKLFVNHIDSSIDFISRSDKRKSKRCTDIDTITESNIQIADVLAKRVVELDATTEKYNATDDPEAKLLKCSHLAEKCKDIRLTLGTLNKTTDGNHPQYGDVAGRVTDSSNKSSGIVTKYDRLEKRLSDLSREMNLLE